MQDGGSGSNHQLRRQQNDQQRSIRPSCRQRTFSYDSLGRLLQAVNSESGTVSYSYDNAGNVLTRTDNRGIQTTLNYDALDRLTQKSYSDLTSTVYLSYDSAYVTNGLGRLASIANGSSVTTFSAYDAMGNVMASGQQTNAQNYSALAASSYHKWASCCRLFGRRRDYRC